MIFTYSKTQRQRIAEVFTLAKQHLRTRNGEPGHTYICNAIRLSVPPSTAKKRAMHVVRDRLEGAHTLRHWLERRGIDCSDDTVVQMHRHNWLDQLIAEFSN